MQKRDWKILLVDDDEDDYMITREMLAEARGANVRLAWVSTYEAAREALRSDDFTAALIDYDLGIHTGLELIKEFSGLHANTGSGEIAGAEDQAAAEYRAGENGRPYPLILLTGRGTYEVDLEAMQAGATMYLAKGEINALLLERAIRYSIEMAERETRLEQTTHNLALELAERRRAETALSQQSAWLRLAFEATDLGTWQHDIITNRVTFDERARAHYGFDRLVVPYEAVMERIHPEDIERLGDEIGATISPTGTGRYAAEYRVIHPNGEVRHLAVQSRLYFEGEGAARRPSLGVGTTQDITEKREAELALARHDERQALLLSITHDILTGVHDLPDLTRLVFEKISGPLDADVCFNYQAESDAGPLRLVAGFGIPGPFWDASQKLEFNQAFCGTVAATRRPILADEQRIQTDPKGVFVRNMGVRAYACHPLFSRSGRVLGTLSLCSTRRSSFSPEDIDFLQTLTHFVALAWDQAGVEKTLKAAGRNGEEEGRD